MSRETEYFGQWWLPSAPERRIGGHLDLSGAILELTLDAPLLAQGYGDQDFDVIHGLAKGGFDLTLLGAYSIRDWPVGNWYAVGDVVVGAHLNQLDTRFAETAAVVDHLPAWIPAQGIEITGTGRGNPGEKVLEVSYTAQPSLKGRLADGTQVSISSSAARSHSVVAGHTLNYAASITWTHLTRAAIEDIVTRDVVPMQMLVAWATQRPVTVTAAYLRVEPGGEWLEWRRRWRKPSAADEESPIGNIRVFASDLANPTFGDGLQRWLGVLDRNQEAIDLMVSLLFAPEEFVDIDVTLVAQSLEAYHRSTFQKERWPEAIFEERRRVALARFNDAEESVLKEWLAEVLEHANEPFLSERLNDLHEKVAPVLSDLLAVHEHWAGMLKKMRNTYTHRGKTRGRQSTYDRGELREIARLGRLVLDVCLMLDLGVSADTCRERVHRWSDYSFAMHDARKRRAPP